MNEKNILHFKSCNYIKGHVYMQRVFITKECFSFDNTSFSYVAQVAFLLQQFQFYNKSFPQEKKVFSNLENIKSLSYTMKARN